MTKPLLFSRKGFPSTTRHTDSHGLRLFMGDRPSERLPIEFDINLESSDFEKQLSIDSHSRYTLEDTGVQLIAGDGINLSRYKSYLPPDLNLD